MLLPDPVLWTPVRDYLRRRWPLLPIAPAAGTTDWIDLAEDDPRKIAALITAGSRAVLEAELEQRYQQAWRIWLDELGLEHISIPQAQQEVALKNAADVLAAQFDWAQIAHRVRERDRFYRSHPHLRKAA